MLRAMGELGRDRAWIAANALAGAAIGLLMLFSASAALLAFGFIVGLAQCIALTRTIGDDAFLWLFASIGGSLIGGIILFFCMVAYGLDPNSHLGWLLAALLIGASIGSTQDYVVTRTFKDRGRWWFLATLIGAIPVVALLGALLAPTTAFQQGPRTAGWALRVVLEAALAGAAYGVVTDAVLLGGEYGALPWKGKCARLARIAATLAVVVGLLNIGVLRGHNVSQVIPGDDVLGLAISTDARTIAVVAGPSSGVWTPEARYPRWSIGAATSAAFSPDGAVLAVGEQGGFLSLWRVADGVRLSRLRPGISDLFALAWNAEGSQLATVAGDGTLAVWDIAANAQEPKVLAQESFCSRFYCVPRLAFGDEGTVVVASAVGVHVWRIADGTPLPVPLTANLGGGTLALSADGRLLAVPGQGGIQVWRLADGALLHTLAGHRDGINALAFSRDGAWLISGSGSIQSGIAGPYDTTARIWRVESGDQERVIEGILSPERSDLFDLLNVRGVPISSVALAPDGRAAGVITSDGSVRFRLLKLP